jgi:AcrR family transcriptional regulator
MVGLREKGKTRRRGEVLAAGAELWRERGVTSVTLAQVAEAAEVSAQTVYNLIGGVEAVKIALVEELLGRLETAVEAAEARGLEMSILRALTSARLFIADPRLYRQILVGIPQAVFEGAQLSRDGSAFQRTALEDARQLGELPGDVDVDALSWQIHLQFLGALFAWACGTLDDQAFLRAVEIGVVTPLAVCATEPARTRLQARARALLAVAARAEYAS